MGYVYNEERIVGIRCVAVPIFRNQEVIAALAIAAHADHISRTNLKHIATKLHAAVMPLQKRNPRQHIIFGGQQNESSSHCRKYS
ncbi:hypothetical protein GN156_07590 [bacterium LRH843]|nr:hypothetical protein [bacterium LRH843]